MDQILFYILYTDEYCLVLFNKTFVNIKINIQNGNVQNNILATPIKNVAFYPSIEALNYLLFEYTAPLIHCE